MLKNQDDLFAALLDRIDACPVALTPAAKEWYAQDAETVRLKKLLDIYSAAREEAPKYGWIGVGSITFAERALRAAQEEN